MNTEQLNSILTSDKITSVQFQGVYASDRLPSHLEHYPCAVVANTDPSYEPGSHWVAFYFDENQQAEFWDSYGQSPEIYSTRFKDFLHTNAVNWVSNNRMLQSLDSNVCGHYCIFYLVHRCRGFNLNSIVNHFSKNTLLNDSIVLKFVNHHYPFLNRDNLSRVKLQVSKPRH